MHTTGRFLTVVVLGSAAWAQGQAPDVDPGSAGTRFELELERAAHTPPGVSRAENALPEDLSPGDWADIRAAYEVCRRAAHPVDDGYLARNPGQRWRTWFDGRGFRTRPDAGGWTWGLELVRYGFAGDEREVTRPERTGAEGGRVTYAWDATLDEWYVNDALGLEHGYTVHRRPGGERGSDERLLTLTLGVRGSLRPEVVAGGRDVCFLDGDGVTKLTYTGLRVFDADERELAASFESVEEGLRLRVDERGASYPLTIDPTAQQAYLKASNTGVDDVFGTSVSVSGDTVVIGAPHEDSDSTGVDGADNDNLVDPGAAYVFARNGTIWSHEAYLKASNTDALDDFGRSVSVSGDRIVVGAPGEDGGDPGVNGNQDDSFNHFSSGAAYVFVRGATSWSQEAYLKASNPNENDLFGTAVWVAGDLVVVGAIGEESDGTSEGDNSLLSAGAAYVFEHDGTQWSQQAYLKAMNVDAHDEFGSSISTGGSTIVVGAPGEDSSATGVDGDDMDNTAGESGAAYVFAYDGSAWLQDGYLKASNTGVMDFFGRSVSASGDTVVVGAPEEDGSATGVNGDDTNDGAGRAGAAYVFVLGGVGWEQQAYLKASNTGVIDFFGGAVAVSGDQVVVGATGESSPATGVNGDQGDGRPSSGAAYQFERTGTTWSQLAFLKASNTGELDRFGGAVAVSGETVVIGAAGEDSVATGVNGDQGSSGDRNTGAAYVFDPMSFSFCDASDDALDSCPCGNPGSPDTGCDTPVPAMQGGGTTGGIKLTVVLQETSPQNRATVTGFGYPAASTPPVIVIRAESLVSPVVFGDGLRCIGTPIVRLSAVIAWNRTSWHTFGHGAMAGSGAFYYQLWFRSAPISYCDDEAAFNLSNGRRLTW